jgi:hypothetical protein
MLMNRDELVELVKKIKEDECSEDEINSWIDLLHENVPHPDASDLIFYSKEELSAEEIVDKALNYKTPLLG